MAVSAVISPIAKPGCELFLLANLSLRARTGREMLLLSPDRPFPEHALHLEGWAGRSH